MRSIDHKTHVPSALHETKTGNSKPWFDVWNWYQERLDRGRSVGGFHVYSYAEWLEKQIQEGGWFGQLWGSVLSKAPRKLNPQVAVYGHDSKMGLQVHRWSKGLDSGCVSGGRLTAMVLDARGETEVVQAASRRGEGKVIMVMEAASHTVGVGREGLDKLLDKALIPEEVTPVRGPLGGAIRDLPVESWDHRVVFELGLIAAHAGLSEANQSMLQAYERRLAKKGGPRLGLKSGGTASAQISLARTQGLL
ncbi:hypothetical protein B0A55_11459 [Friedmanniomyces simplex]|uniref:Uncharacterized protein n=1 Tax=Friedmanniomyces simplex TaxID=329884 RepID=A0A4U0WFZ0_9PEZI|nr:hypothetical protein B0A55_11459 [Friedmanniomyces simplex]